MGERTDCVYTGREYFFFFFAKCGCDFASLPLSSVPRQIAVKGGCGGDGQWETFVSVTHTPDSSVLVDDGSSHGCWRDGNHAYDNDGGDDAFRACM